MELLFNQANDNDIEALNYDSKTVFYSKLAETDFSILVYFMYAVTIGGLFMILFFKFKGQHGTLVNLFMLLWFVHRLESNLDGKESFEGVMVPLILANSINTASEVLFLVNWKSKRNGTASLTRHLYQITDLQILTMMMELTG